MNIGLVMMIRWQADVGQTTVRGEAVAAGGRGSLHCIMLRLHCPPVIAIGILRRHLSVRDRALW